MVERLTAEVHRIEATDGMLADWSLPGEDAASAAFDLARTVCRRAERLAVRVSAEGTPIAPNVLRYLNRLSDLLWLYGRCSSSRRTSIRNYAPTPGLAGLAPGSDAG